MNDMFNLRYFFERRGFAASSKLGDLLGIRTKNIRLFFIYLSFATLGIGFGLYLLLAFFFKLKGLVYSKRSSVFDL